MQGTMGKPSGKSNSCSSAGPPDKRRRVERASSSADQLWDDDACDFTEDQLVNIDMMVACSQQISSNKPPQLSFDTSNKHSSNAAQRSVGRGVAKSLSASAVSDNSPSNAVQNTSKPSISRLIGGSQRAGIHPLSTNGSIAMGQLTPTAATTGSGKVSPGLPSSSSKGNADMEKLKESCSQYHKEIQKMKESQYSKDGQIKILRDNLRQVETELRQLKQDKLLQLEKHAQEKSEREKELEKEVQHLSTRLLFLNKELQDMQSAMKRKDPHHASNSCGAASQSPLSPAFPGVVINRGSPRKTPLPVSPARTPTSSRAFPSRETFMSQERSPKKYRPSKGVQVGSAGAGSASRRQRRTALTLNTNRRPRAQDLASKLLLPEQLSDSHDSQSVTYLLSSLNSLHLNFPASADQRSSNAETDLASVQQLVSNVQDATEKLLQSPSDCTSQACSRLLSTYLPLISLCIKAFLQINHEMIESPNTSHRGSPSELHHHHHHPDPAAAASAAAAAAESGSSSHPSSDDKLSIVTQNLNSSLDVLLTIVKFSPDLRLIITKETVKEVAMETDDAPASCDDLVENCNLLDLLLTLVEPREKGGKGLPCPLLCKALDILQILAESADTHLLARFEKLLSLLTIITKEGLSSFELVLRSMSLLAVLVRSPVLLPLLCTQPEECVWMTVYTYISQTLSLLSADQSTCLAAGLVELLGMVLSCFSSGVSCLLEAACQCSVLHVRCLIMVLHSQYTLLHSALHDISRSSSAHLSDRCSVQLGVLRRGVILLHTLSQNDQLFCRQYQDIEHLYVELVAGMEAVYRRERSDVAEDEVSAVQELWELELDPLEVSEDEPDQPNSSLPETVPNTTSSHASLRITPAEPQIQQHPSVQTVNKHQTVVKPQEKRMSQSAVEKPAEEAGVKGQSKSGRGKGRGLRLKTRSKHSEPMEVISID